MKYFYYHEEAHVPHECARGTPFKDQNRQEEWKPTKNKSAGYQGNCISDVKVLETKTMGKNEEIVLFVTY